MDDAKKRIMYNFLTESIGLEPRAAALSVFMASQADYIYRIDTDWIFKCKGWTPEAPDQQCTTHGIQWQDACYWCQHFLIEIELQTIMDEMK